MALQLGVLIAEGLIAVEAQDASEMREVGNAARTLARSLGVEKAMLRHSQSIIEHADESDWAATRHEWDGGLTDLESGMHELHSEALAQDVSLGGWLRGAEALSTLLLQNYSPERARLLRQLALLDQFHKRLPVKDKDGRQNAASARMQAGMTKVRELIENDDAPISKDAPCMISKPFSQNSSHGLERGRTLYSIRTAIIASDLHHASAFVYAHGAACLAKPFTANDLKLIVEEIYPPKLKLTAA